MLVRNSKITNITEIPQTQGVKRSNKHVKPKEESKYTPEAKKIKSNHKDQEGINYFTSTKCIKLVGASNDMSVRYNNEVKGTIITALQLFESAIKKIMKLITLYPGKFKKHLQKQSAQAEGKISSVHKLMMLTSDINLNTYISNCGLLDYYKQLKLCFKYIDMRTVIKKQRVDPDTLDHLTRMWVIALIDMWIKHIHRRLNPKHKTDKAYIKLMFYIQKMLTHPIHASIVKQFKKLSTLNTSWTQALITKEKKLFIIIGPTNSGKTKLYQGLRYWVSTKEIEENHPNVKMTLVPIHRGVHTNMLKTTLETDIFHNQTWIVASHKRANERWLEKCMELAKLHLYDPIVIEMKPSENMDRNQAVNYLATRTPQHTHRISNEFNSISSKAYIEWKRKNDIIALNCLYM